MGQAGRDRRQPDPVMVMARGLRRMSNLRLDDITRGFENFANPSAAGLLESLGRSESERVETMTAMLRNSSQADIEALGAIFGLAMTRLAEERAEPPAPDGQTGPGSRRNRESPSAAERRRETRSAAERRQRRERRESS